MTHTLRCRAERLDLSFPVVFHGDDGPVDGHCLNMSASGLLATFARPLELWTVGKVTLWGAGLHGSLRARVARVQEHQGGLAFQFATDAEHRFVEELLDLAVRTTQLVGRPPF